VRTLKVAAAIRRPIQMNHDSVPLGRGGADGGPDMVTPTWAFAPGPGPKLVHVSTSGGAVAELLTGLVPAQAETGLPVGWAVIGGDTGFFSFTRYLHHLLHGRADAMTADRLAVAVPRYRDVLAPQAAWLAGQVTPDDVVVLHDPATLGMATTLAGPKLVWHCHVGTTDERATGPAAVWYALGAELSTVDFTVTPLPEFVPVPPARKRVIAPAVDPRSARNRPLWPAELVDLLDSPGHVEEDVPVPGTARVVLQVSAWDLLADVPGVLRCVPDLPSDVHFVLAGEDTPADRAMLTEVRAHRAELSPPDRARVHLVLPDPRRAALVVNALQRRADVVLQKSLAEGSGLSVTEAMVKARAVVAADVGGLREQISPGHNGILVDPRDRAAVVAALRTLLDDPLLRRRLGLHAAESARRRYLMPRLVADYRRFVVPDLPTRLPETA
jgi:trehalose synthase